MRERRGRRRRVLAVDPTRFGCCFAVLESDRGLVDWGSRYVMGKGKNAETVAAALKLVRLYRPDLLALEDCWAPGSRRRVRVKTLIERLEGVAKGQRVRVALVGLPALRKVCVGGPKATKYDVAVALAQRFPELARGLPPKRKLWMSEHPRMSVFDAVALAVTALEGRSRRRPPARGDP